MTQIVDNLYLGHIDNAREADKYDVIINCTVDIPFYSTETENHRLVVKDNGDFRQLDIMNLELPNMIKIIDGAITAGKNVLVHCQAGQSRSPSVVAGYLLSQNQDWSVDETIRFVKSKSNNAFFGGCFFRPCLEKLSQ